MLLPIAPLFAVADRIDPELVSPLDAEGSETVAENHTGLLDELDAFVGRHGAW